MPAGNRSGKAGAPDARRNKDGCMLCGGSGDCESIAGIPLHIIRRIGITNGAHCPGARKGGRILAFDLHLACLVFTLYRNAGLPGRKPAGSRGGGVNCGRSGHIGIGRTDGSSAVWSGRRTCTVRSSDFPLLEAVLDGSGIGKRALPSAIRHLLSSYHAVG